MLRLFCVGFYAYALEVVMVHHTMWLWRAEVVWTLEVVRLVRAVRGGAEQW